MLMKPSKILHPLIEYSSTRHDWNNYSNVTYIYSIKLSCPVISDVSINQQATIRLSMSVIAKVVEKSSKPHSKALDGIGVSLIYCFKLATIEIIIRSSFIFNNLSQSKTMIILYYKIPDVIFTFKEPPAHLRRPGSLL